MKKKDKQPDFQGLFFEHLGGKPRKQRYELRFGTSNLYHDVIFLSSLIHDARFKMDNIRTRGHRLYIDLERDTWELGMEPLNYCKSRLTICGVVGTELRDENPLDERCEELCVRDIALTEEWDHYDYSKDSRFRLVLNCDDKVFHMFLDEKLASVVLRDTTVVQLD